MIDIGAPIWQLEASSLYCLWTIDRLPPHADVAVITWDASAFGVGFSFRETSRKILHCEGRTFDSCLLGSHLESELEAQPLREAWGGAIAVRCFVERQALSKARHCHHLRQRLQRRPVRTQERVKQAQHAIGS